jgi:hypothetical protein
MFDAVVGIGATDDSDRRTGYLGSADPPSTTPTLVLA